MTVALRDASTVRIAYARVEPERQHADRLLALLSADERERHGRFHFERDRAVFRAAHALVRRVLGEITGLAPEAHAFEAGSHGKPRLLRAPEGLDFNLSHTAGMVACALSWDAPVGVDVEHTTRHADLAGVGARVFTAAERAGFEGLGPEAQVDRFFEYWTLKEAYMKALGLGFSLPPASFELSPDRVAGYCVHSVDAPAVEADWSFFATRLGEHRLACAVGAQNRAFRLEPYLLE